MDSRPELVSPRRAPRTLAEAQAHRSGRLNILPSVDTKASPFGDYDDAMIFAIASRWYGLIDNAGAAENQTGRTVILFRLHDDGRVTNLEIKERTVSKNMARLCRDAVHDAAPYKKWPDEMRSLNGNDYRNLTFTFYYK